MLRPILLATVFALTALSQASEEEDSVLLQRIRQYWKCLELLVSQDKSDDNDDSKCSPSFDGWLCWPLLDTGQEHSRPCPGYRNASVARRFCHVNRTWEGASASIQSLEDFHRETLNWKSPCAARNSVEQDARFWRAISFSEGMKGSPYDLEGSTLAYEDCIIRVLSKEVISGTSAPTYCPRTFDGWSCWNDTRAGEVAFATCPNFVHGLDPRRMSHKVCTAEGSWFRHPETNNTWSNYTTCVDHEDLLFRNKVNALYVAGYSLSLTALVVSLILFFTFNSLKCGRVTIHKHLFVSFILNNTLWIVSYTMVVPDTDVVGENKMPCQVLHIVIHYFLVSNYFWMFCEGFYLHTLLVLTFVAETKVMRAIYVIGWGIPLILIIAYALARIYSSPEATIYCWLEKHWSVNILSVPVCISLVMNLGFLINIVRVLVTKLRAVNSPDSHRTRKAARATLILIPLLGLHYGITPFQPEAGSTGEHVYSVMAAIVTSLQGFCVALLFCFFNGEVISLVRKKWTQEILMRQNDRRTSYAATTISFSVRHSPTEDARHLHEKLMSKV